jgi:AraC-like DNA-binding protein
MMKHLADSGAAMNSCGQADQPPLVKIVLDLLLSAGTEVEHDYEAAKAHIGRALELLQAQGSLRTAPSSGDGNSVRKGGLAPWQIRVTKAYIEHNIDQVVRIEDLAAVTRLSASYFSAAFRRSFGEPPHSYLVRQRIERAQHLMLTTDEPLSRVARSCGLCDQAHFSKLFRRAVGVAPNIWRRERQVAPHLAAAA